MDKLEFYEAYTCDACRLEIQQKRVIERCKCYPYGMYDAMQNLTHYKGMFRSVVIVTGAQISDSDFRPFFPISQIFSQNALESELGLLTKFRSVFV